MPIIRTGIKQQYGFNDNKGNSSSSFSKNFLKMCALLRLNRIYFYVNIRLEMIVVYSSFHVYAIDCKNNCFGDVNSSEKSIFGFAFNDREKMSLFGFDEDIKEKIKDLNLIKEPFSKGLMSKDAFTDLQAIVDFGYRDGKNFITDYKLEDELDKIAIRYIESDEVDEPIPEANKNVEKEDILQFLKKVNYAYKEKGSRCYFLSRKGIVVIDFKNKLIGKVEKHYGFVDYTEKLNFSEYTIATMEGVILGRFPRHSLGKVENDKLLNDWASRPWKEHKRIETNNSADTEDEKDEKYVTVEIEEKDYSKFDFSSCELLGDMNREKSEIYHWMEDTDRNIFITGKAGTGKSYLLEYFKKHTKKKVAYTAPTGVAALHIGAVTLHSLFGFDNINEGRISRNIHFEELRRIDTLVIDEISMVKASSLDVIDRLMQRANKNELPFGGKQVILVGDLFQLPPVISDWKEEWLLKRRYGNVYFFSSHAFEKGNFYFRELDQVYRQTDEEFTNILNNIREGKNIPYCIRQLNEKCFRDYPDWLLKILCKRDAVQTENMFKINEIREPEFNYTYRNLTPDKTPNESDFICEFNLRLKKGARVMMVKNDSDNRWVNGSLGTVVDLYDDFVMVKIKDEVYKVQKQRFETQYCYYDKEADEIRYATECAIEQIPVVPAYAITIHKSQGMTYDSIATDITDSFEAGQAYVALSRCRTMEGLFLIKEIPMNSDCIMVDRDVLRFYEKMREENETELSEIVLPKYVTVGTTVIITDKETGEEEIRTIVNAYKMKLANGKEVYFDQFKIDEVAREDAPLIRELLGKTVRQEALCNGKTWIIDEISKDKDEKEFMINSFDDYSY